MIFGRESFIANLQVFKEKLSRIALIVVCRLFSAKVSVNSKPDHPLPPGDPGDSHILVAPGVGFSLRYLARGSAWGFAGGLHGGLPGVSNQSKSSIILKKSVIFAAFLKQLSGSSFHMFICARSEQCDLVPIYTL